LKGVAQGALFGKNKKYNYAPEWRCDEPKKEGKVIESVYSKPGRTKGGGAE